MMAYNGSELTLGKCDNSQDNPLEDPVQLLSEDLVFT